MSEVYDLANEVELACTSEGCKRDDCNGFICHNAIDAAVAAERKRCAEIAGKYSYDSGVASRIEDEIEAGA